MTQIMPVSAVCLLAALTLTLASPLSQKVHIAEKAVVESSFGKCEICELILLAIDAVGTKDQAKLEATLDAECEKLPLIGTECAKLVNQYLEEIINELNAGTGRYEVCAKVKLCPSTVAAKYIQEWKTVVKNAAMAKVETPILPEVDKCEFCEVILFIMYQEEQNYTESQVESKMDSYCKYLGPLQAECDKLVKQYVPLIYKEVQQGTNRYKICDSIGLCSQKLRQAVVQFSFGKCEICEMILLAIDAIGTNDEAKLEATLDAECEKLPLIGTECAKLVNQYLEEIINELNAGTGRYEVCAKVKLCSSSFYIREWISALKKAAIAKVA